ncbi:hypothetical protein CYMTET_11528 [Cymbomonas tetramitiformis]|uniref:Uncharacterized protein n=1 Tax=Cymbomonas tetramitiformis TaxID=36881 RepID=A0AAE0GNH6_9CHLO|nr:hypothetical protein CYMTET_11528 [Cymbomonas tetramitiformis]
MYGVGPHSGDLRNNLDLETYSHVDSTISKSPAHTFGERTVKGEPKLRSSAKGVPGPGSYNPVATRKLPVGSSWALESQVQSSPPRARNPKTKTHPVASNGNVTSSAIVADGSFLSREISGLETLVCGSTMTVASRASTDKRGGIPSPPVIPLQSGHSPEIYKYGKPTGATFTRTGCQRLSRFRDIKMSHTMGGRGFHERFIDDQSLGPGEYNPYHHNMRLFGNADSLSKHHQRHGPGDRSTASLDPATWQRESRNYAASLAHAPGTLFQSPNKTQSRRSADVTPGPGHYHTGGVPSSPNKLPPRAPQYSFGVTLPSMFNPSTHVDPLRIHPTTHITSTTVPFHHQE